jgi:RNA polymerase sigma-70 factor, ECF subfamily
MNDDSGLPALLAADLEGHFERVVRTYQDRLYSFALRTTGSPRDAEESTQDAFVRAYRALQGYDAQRRRELQLRPWLYRITLNVVRNRARRLSVGLVTLDGELENSLTAHAGQEPEHVAERRETRQRLARAIADLPDRYAAAVTLRHVQGLSYAEAADVLDQPVGTTKSDVHRGLRLLREALQSEQLVAAGSY